MQEKRLENSKPDDLSGLDTEICHHRIQIMRECLVLFLQGDVTQVCEQAVMDAYAEMIAGEHRAMILDFSQVRYINSAGIAVLINLLNRLKQRQQFLYIADLSEYFMKIFSMIGLTRYSKCFSSIDEAIANRLGEIHS